MFEIYYRRSPRGKEMITFINLKKEVKVVIVCENGNAETIYTFVGSIYVPSTIAKISLADLIILEPFNHDKVIDMLNKQKDTTWKDSVPHIKAIERLIEYFKKELLT